MVVPIVYRKSTEGSVSYDWLDAVSGVGYRTYYPCISALNGGNVYFLSTRIIDGNPPYISVDPVAVGTPIDIDFDISFARQGYISGIAYFNVTHTQPDDTTSTYININVYHVDAAASETLIGTCRGVTRNTAGGAAVRYYRECLKATLTGKNFSFGEKLRVNIQLVVGGQGAGAKNYKMYCDPSSIATFTETTYGRVGIGSDITADIPFKIDL